MGLRKRTWNRRKGGRVLVVGVTNWFKKTLIRDNRPDVPGKWSGDLIRGYVCNFRRVVVRVWAQTACRANSQSSTHYLWKPSGPWRDANRWTCGRYYVSVTCLSSFTERSCCCMCCRKHGRWRADNLEGLILYSISLPRASCFLVVCPGVCRGNTVAPYGAQKKNRKQEGRKQGTTFERMA